MIVLGDGFSGLRRFEASDVIGRGDIVASYELVTHFARIGYKRMQPVFADRVVNDQPGRSLRRNMVVLGGPDANSVSRECLKGVSATYQMVWADGRDMGAAVATSLRPPQLVLTTTAKSNEVPVMEPTLEGDEVTHDYGVIIRSRNPFEYWGPKRPVARRSKRVVIMYGCYGYGTMAAVLYSRTREFLEMIKSTDSDIECIVRCRIVLGTPQAIEQVFFKAYPYGHLVQRAAVTGPGSDAQMPTADIVAD